MKNILVIFCLALFSIPTWAHHSLGRLPQQITRVAVAAQEEQLASFVVKHLQNYYGRTDFRDPKHQTGWYRIDEFITWMKQNEKELAQETMILIDRADPAKFPSMHNLSLQDVVKRPETERSALLMRAFWINLGVHYVASQYQAGIRLNPIMFEIVSQGLTATAGPSYFKINAKDEPHVFPVDINIGIHEGTHDLFATNETLQAKAPQNTEAVLSELATFYSQYHYSLPIKIADGKTFPGGGVRYLPKNYQSYPDFNYQLEYQQFVLGPLIVHQMTPQQVLTLFDDPLQPDMPVWESVFIYLAAQNNQYLSIDLQTTSHQIRVNPQNLGDTARKFGFTQKDAEQWLSAQDTFIDLGKHTWPGTNSKEHIFLWKSSNAQELIFIGGAKHHSTQDFLKMTFGPYSRDPKITQFYNELLKALPPAVKQIQTQQCPTIIVGQSLNAVYQKAVAPYRAQWRKALVQTLKKVGITQAPAIPQGYL